MNITCVTALYWNNRVCKRQPTKLKFFLSGPRQDEVACSMWRCMPTISAFGRLRQGN